MISQPAPGEGGSGTSHAPHASGTARTPGASGQRLWSWLRRPQGVFAAVIAVAAVATLIVAVSSGGPGGSGADTSSVSVSFGSVNQVDLQAVPGQLTIVGAATGRVTLSGQLKWSDHAQPSATTRMVSPHTLRLAYRCIRLPCTARWRLVVPRHTAVVLNQPGGHVTVSGLGGSLWITAANVDVSATGLRSPSLKATITSGHLTAGFAAAPRNVDVTLASAQATLRLPGNVSYAVSDQVASGYIHVGVPQDPTAPRGVSAHIVSGELELLPA